MKYQIQSKINRIIQSRFSSDFITFNIQHSTREAGQSIIETVVGIFILIMGITAALGLATFSFGSSGAISRQLIATGLAREGIEAVKSMRDSNWLRSTKSTDCVDWSVSPVTNTAVCYKSWLNPGTTDTYNIAGAAGTGQYYRLDFDSTSTGINPNTRFWALSPVPAGSDFRLYLDSAIAATTVPNAAVRIYSHNASGTRVSDYYRRITIIQETATAPYNNVSADTTGPRLLVRSDVWWTDKKCPAVTTYEAASETCRISVQTYLTNWKAY